LAGTKPRREAGKAALLEMLGGPSAASMKLPLREALEDALEEQGFRSVTLRWVASNSIQVYAAREKTAYRFEAECSPHGTVDERLDELFDNLVKAASEVALAPQ
jgi:hypothetical protein